MTSSSLIISFLIVGLLFFIHAIWKHPDKIKPFKTFPSFLLGFVIIVTMWPSLLYFQLRESTRKVK